MTDPELSLGRGYRRHADSRSEAGRGLSADTGR